MGPLHLKHRHNDYGEWTSDAVHFGAGGFGTEPGGVVTICRMKAGKVLLTAGRESFAMQRGDIFVLADAAHAHSARWTDADCTMVGLPASTFALHARTPVTKQAGRRLAQVVGFAERHLADQRPPPQRVMLDAIGHVLAATVLTTFTNTPVAESSPLRSRSDVPTTVALAQDFIARNADLPITPSDIARHASVSKRALQMAFREHLSTSPAAYLRRYRLTRVHEELMSAAPGAGISVTQVAARWVFTELSRFAASYRHVYGQSPSATFGDKG